MAPDQSAAVKRMNAVPPFFGKSITHFILKYKNGPHSAGWAQWGLDPLETVNAYFTPR